jgi:excisionase family DNA binding protein
MKKKPDRIDVHETAEILSVHFKTAYRWAQEGRIPSTELPCGRVRVVFSRKAITAWLKTNTVNRGGEG